MHPKIDKEIFRAYDIRGIVGRQFNEEVMLSLGHALAVRLHALKRHQVYIGRDARLSSEALASALCQGLRHGGIEVVDVGVVSTPMLYFAASTTPIDSGLMITGSHNPADYNGLKMVLAGTTLCQADIEILYQTVVDLPHPVPAHAKPGAYATFDITPAYQARLVEDITLSRPLKVVVDAGNGMAGPFAPAVLEALGCEVIPLYCELDGRFPNHHPDPTVEANLRELRETVLATGADIGLGFDGDADRLGVVTNTGDIIWPDRLMMFYVTDILTRYPGAPIVFDVKCSKGLTQHILRLGGEPVMSPTGHSIVKATMKKLASPLAGEMSGHLFFKDRWYGFDDALYSACRLVELLSQSSLSVAEQFAALPFFLSTPEIKIPIAEDKKFNFMREFSATPHFETAERILIDGLRVEFETGWGLVRASNTTPCLVARFEAESQVALEEIQAVFRTALLALDESLVLPF